MGEMQARPPGGWGGNPPEASPWPATVIWSLSNQTEEYGNELVELQGHLLSIEACHGELQEYNGTLGSCSWKQAKIAKSG